MRNENFELCNYIMLNQVGFILQVYEPVEEGSYIKMIDMVKGKGGQLQVTNIIFLVILLSCKRGIQLLSLIFTRHKIGSDLLYLKLY
jgi:hypothetical protein